MSASSVVVLRSTECLSRVVVVVPDREDGGYFVFTEKQHEPGAVGEFGVYWYWEHPCMHWRRKCMGQLGSWSRREEFLPRFEYRVRGDFDLAT
eukprot:1894726-Alexandrium_andersonii.AAC.1